MPQGAGLLALLFVIGMFVVSAHDSPHYLRVTGKDDRPDCHQITYADLDTDPQNISSVCVPADLYRDARVGDRYLGPTS